MWRSTKQTFYLFLIRKISGDEIVRDKFRGLSLKLPLQYITLSLDYMKKQVFCEEMYESLDGGIASSQSKTGAQRARAFEP